MRHSFYSCFTSPEWSTVQCLLHNQHLTSTTSPFCYCCQIVIAMFCSFFQLLSLSLSTAHISPLSTSTSMLILALLSILLFTLYGNQKSRSCTKNVKSNICRPPPGPKPWPIYGNLDLLATDANPWEAFKRLREQYGDIFQLTLGRKKCVVVSSLEAINEVLLKKASSFGSRPNFLRYHALFGGDRDNSLALCDWSTLQKARRTIAYPYVFPKSTNLEHLATVICSELDEYVALLNEKCASNKDGHTVYDKAHFSAVCANIFYQYFCSKRYEFTDEYFLGMVRRYDDIFHDINNGFALDFLPWLVPFKLFHLFKLYGYGQYIRKFLLKTLIQERNKEGIDEQHPRDFLDLILSGNSEAQENGGKLKKKMGRLSEAEALYELEDLLGGHSAVSCFWTRLLAQVLNRPDVKLRIRSEIDAVVADDGVVNLCHRSRMPYTQAAIHETLRVTTSPIVPHVASEDATIDGYEVKKDSMIFLNNYYLNLSEQYWVEPQNFDPNRFLNEAGKFTKPAHFLPFSTGRRSCLGYQLVLAIVFLSTVKMIQNFDISSSPDVQPPKVMTRKISRDVECAKLSVYDTDVKAFIRPRY